MPTIDKRQALRDDVFIRNFKEISEIYLETFGGNRLPLRG